MAKTNKKYHYYVLVFTNNGPVYVTKVDYSTKSAYWRKDEKPLEMSKECARDLCLGLCCNFNNAIVVEMFYELDTQPYRYDVFEIEFKEKEK